MVKAGDEDEEERLSRKLERSSPVRVVDDGDVNVEPGMMSQETKVARKAIDTIVKSFRCFFIAFPPLLPRYGNCRCLRNSKGVGRRLESQF